MKFSIVIMYHRILFTYIIQSTSSERKQAYSEVDNHKEHAENGPVLQSMDVLFIINTLSWVLCFPDGSTQAFGGCYINYTRTINPFRHIIIHITYW